MAILPYPWILGPTSPSDGLDPVWGVCRHVKVNYMLRILQASVEDQELISPPEGRILHTLKIILMAIFI